MNMSVTLIFLFLISTFSFARSPAVEPVSGLSIDHIEKPKDTSPTSTGYNWSQVDASLSTGLQQKDLINNKTNQEISLYLLIAGLSLVPLVLVMLSRRKWQSAKEDQHNFENVVALPKRNDENKNDDDISKAS